ncbi:hypothetical protein G8770_13060 [Aestuariicella hydrocarbonica]|uniref:Uncharacterized protein n=1 Tax=Pseudomaricurvus hydrocarbonicus TaxID=1470433 RepID=A0A9E5MHV8_9GAMM|nr:hypothetical protein [Aestuariicella hydrocarbonica]NHO66471.1 hypothetical protein [Aestuariicella hydrocarbonica]
MWLPILICLAAVALLLGPVLLMQPTASQRREAALRNLAMQKGLRVHLQPAPAGVDLPARTKTVPIYCRPWTDKKSANPAWVLIKKKYDHGLHAHGNWDWSKKPDGASLELRFGTFWPLLDQLPERVVGVANGPQGLCCYWNELGGEEVVSEIQEWLEKASLALKQN